MDHASFPRVTDPLAAPAWLPSCSNLQAGIISPCTPRSKLEALGKTEGQEKGMAKKGTVKDGNMAFETCDTPDVEL